MNLTVSKKLYVAIKKIEVDPSPLQGRVDKVNILYPVYSTFSTL
jgi:hypothetical protein